MEEKKILEVFVPVNENTFYDWPLTVPSGHIKCGTGGELFFIDLGGDYYSLNSKALMSRAYVKKISRIWKPGTDIRRLLITGLFLSQMNGTLDENKWLLSLLSIKPHLYEEDDHE